MRRVVFVAIGGTLSLLAFANVFFTPLLDKFVATFTSRGVAGQILIVAIIVGYFAGSLGIVLSLSRRSKGGRLTDALESVRDLTLVAGASGFGSFVLLMLFAIMRDDSPGLGPFVGGAAILVISLLSMVAFSTTAIFLRLHAGREAAQRLSAR